MHKQYKQIWIDALRSGKYKQGVGKLKNLAGEYCCLGVLCDVFKDKYDGKWVHEYEYGGAQFDLHGYRSVYDIPNSLENITGVDLPTRATLTKMNDTEKRTFNEIADYIEENL